MAQERRALNAKYAELERTQYESKPAPPPKNTDFASSPSMEATEDPAPTRHAPATERQQVEEKSKYEASEVWRSKKGNRLH